MSSGTHNILVISDIHLGEDLKPTASPTLSSQLAIVERKLIQFLRHYARTRFDGKPWRLVVNGDMIDFLSVYLAPGEELAGRTPEEHVFGLGRRPRVAIAKLEHVFDRHRNVFRAMASFLAAGNRVELIAGNHDAEIQWSPVQDAFREEMRRTWEVMPEAARPTAPSAEVIAERIAFHPWFFYEPGVVWIEHGHHYDENCSFEFSLAPGHHETREIISNVDDATCRYVTNVIPDANPHGQENWSAFGYVAWARSLGVRGSMRLASCYYKASAKLIGLWHGHSRDPVAREARRERHRERMRALCEHWSISEETLDAVDQLRRQPVFTNLWRLLALLMIDRVIVGAVALVATMVAVAALPLLWALLTGVGVVGSAWMAARWLARGRCVDPVGPLGEMPERILQHVNARYVVFGHTHTPVVQPLADGAAYMNTGTWFPTERPGLLRAFTHVVLKINADGAQGALCQWRDGASRSFTPDRKQPRLVTADEPTPATEVAVAEQAA